jgi:hypothetical protein
VSGNPTDGMPRRSRNWRCLDRQIVSDARRILSAFPGGVIEAIQAFLGLILPLGLRHGRRNSRSHVLFVPFLAPLGVGGNVPFVPFLSPLLARV